MSKGTRPHGGVLEVVKVTFVRLGNRVFARQDAEARKCGWEVTRSPWGLCRRYRDLRFLRRAQGQTPQDVLAGKPLEFPDTKHQDPPEGARNRAGCDRPS
jgi:hypothetical protein